MSAVGQQTIRCICRMLMIGPPIKYLQETLNQSAPSVSYAGFRPHTQFRSPPLVLLNNRYPYHTEDVSGKLKTCQRHDAGKVAASERSSSVMACQGKMPTFVNAAVVRPSWQGSRFTRCSFPQEHSQVYEPVNRRVSVRIPKASSAGNGAPHDIKLLACDMVR